MLIPQTVNMTAYRGGSFSEQVNFWQDDAQSVPFDFSTWTIVVTATLGASVINPHYTVAGGSLIFWMNPSETAAASAANYHFVVTLTATTGSPAEVEYLAHGTMVFVDP